MYTDEPEQAHEYHCAADDDNYEAPKIEDDPGADGRRRSIPLGRGVRQGYERCAVVRSFASSTCALNRSFFQRSRRDLWATGRIVSTSEVSP